jgi:hypothetical protein
MSPRRQHSPHTRGPAGAGNATADGRRAKRVGSSAPPAESESERILGEHDASLLDICDNVLNKGVVLSGDVTIGLAQVDLIYARLSLLLCAADRVLPNEETDVLARHHARHVKRELTRGRGAK